MFVPQLTLQGKQIKFNIPSLRFQMGNKDRRICPRSCTLPRSQKPVWKSSSARVCPDRPGHFLLKEFSVTRLCPEL